jgi:uncharacterized membrane protein (UPF0127 family)
MAALLPRPTRDADRTAAARRQAILAPLLALGLLSADLEFSPAAAFERDTLTIETEAGASHRFDIELAVDPADRSRGLMFRQSMPADHGMLFDFERSQPVTMWMRNTVLPLDMLFIEESGRVAWIAADTTPYSEALIEAPVPVRAVLELNAGTAKRLGIAPGARVVHKLFAPRPG